MDIVSFIDFVLASVGGVGSSVFRFLVTAIVGLVLFFLFFTIVLRIYNSVIGNRRGRIRRWSKTVQFSDVQLSAMRSLWHAFRTNGELQVDPFLNLDTADVADLVNKCDPGAMPLALRDPEEEKARRKLMNELRRRGFNDLHAQVVAGMKFGMLGPARGRS